MIGWRTRARHLVALGLITACNSAQEQPADAGVVDVAMDAPERLAAPMNVVATDGTSLDSVSVTWTPVQAATIYRVWRDGVPIADVVGIAYTDTTAASPVVPSAPALTATSGTYVDRVELSWTPSTSDPGQTHLYFITALSDSEESLPSQVDEGHRGPHQLFRYELSTDGGQSFPEVTMQTSYTDSAAPAGVIAPGAVAASDGTSDTHITVSVSGASVAAGASVAYAVRAVTTGGTVTSNVADGHRGVGPFTYEWYRHDFGEASGATRSLLANVSTATFADSDTAGARLHAYDCTVSSAGTNAVAIEPDLGWRAARASETPRVETWVTHGAVNAVAVADDAIYIGGDFDYVGPPTGAFAAIDATTGIASQSQSQARVQVPHNNGNEVGVSTAVQDSAGRWYIGGDFNAVSGVPQARLARLTSSGQLDRTFAPVVLDGNVHSIAIGGDTLFITGTFTSVDWQSRKGFAALDATTGALKPFSLTVSAPPSMPAFIGTVFVSSGVLFVGGSFTIIEGVARNGIAAIDIESEAVTSWDAQADANALQIAAMSGNTLYVLGAFNQIGGQQRDRVAALDTVTGAATPFNPDPNETGYISALATNGTAVFVAGSFTTIGGQNRREFAALDANTGAALAFQSEPLGSPASSVYTLAIAGNILYVGGDFDTIGTQPRKRIAALDATTGALLSWAPVAPRTVRVITVVNNKVHVGGAFASIAGQQRCCLAALDRTTGALLNWNPGADRGVTALALSGDALFVGGRFENIGGQPRKHLARLDRGTGIATTWTADTDAPVFDLSRSGDTIYVAGSFTSVAGQSRSALAAVDINTASVAAWDPNPNGAVARLASSGGTVYVTAAPFGFSAIGGQQRNRLAAVDGTTGQVTSWDPSPGAAVRDLSVAGGALYVGGEFMTISGQSRSALASFVLATGALSSWTTATTASPAGVHALGVAGNSVYASGFFSVGGRAPDYAGAVDITTGNATVWYPWWFGMATRFVVSGASLIAVGQLRHIAGYPREGIAIFDL